MFASVCLSVCLSVTFVFVSCYFLFSHLCFCYLGYLLLELNWLELKYPKLETDLANPELSCSCCSLKPPSSLSLSVTPLLFSYLYSGSKRTHSIYGKLLSLTYKILRPTTVGLYCSTWLSSKSDLCSTIQTRSSSAACYHLSTTWNNFPVSFGQPHPAHSSSHSSQSQSLPSSPRHRSIFLFFSTRNSKLTFPKILPTRPHPINRLPSGIPECLLWFSF